MLSILRSVLAIIVCGTAGGVAGWLAARAIGLEGVAAALLAAVIGMVVAVALWVVGVVLIDRVRR
jgi:hypothetical protein